MSLYCTLPRGGGNGTSYYHSSIHSPSESGSGSSPSSSSSTITSDSSSSMLTRQSTIGNNYLHSVNPRYQHLQSIKTMFNNITSQQQQQQQQATSSLNEKSTNISKNTEDRNSLIKNQSVNYNYQTDQQSLPQHNDYQDYLKSGDVSLLPSLKNYSHIESSTTPGLSNHQGNQFNQMMGLNQCNNNTNDSNHLTSTSNNMNPNQYHQRQSLQLTIPRPPPEPPQRIYYGLNNFDDLRTIRRNSITSLIEDPPTPNFYGDEDSAYDSTSNESLRLTVKELTKRSNSKKYFTLPTKLGRRLRKSSCPEFAKDNLGNQNNQQQPPINSLTPSPVSDCSPSPKLIFNGPTFPPSVSSLKPTLITSSSIISSSSSSSPTSSISPPSIVSSLSSSPSSSSPPSSSTDVSVSSTVSLSSPTSMVTEMSSPPQPPPHQQPILHNHVDNCVNYQNNQPSSSSTPTSETINSLSPISPTSPSANENVCHCCYLLGCHNDNQNSTITQSNITAHHHQQHGRVNPGGVGINTNTNPNSNNISSTGQPSTLETLWEEPSSGHESVRLTEEAIYAAMRELNISLPSKESVNGQPNRNGNSSSWLRANFLKAFKRSSKNRSSKIISNSNSANLNNGNTNNGTLDYPENDKHLASSSCSSSTIGSRRGSLIMNPDQNNYPSSHHHHDNHHTHQQQQQQSSSSCYSDDISSKRTSSGPSVASSLVSLPLSCSSSVPPTPPLTPLPSYHSYQHHHHHHQQHHQQQNHQHQSQLQLQILNDQHNSTLPTSHIGTEEDVIKELNRQLAEKDQLLQEVCMESINHLNTIESLKELVTQLRQEIDSLKNQNDQQTAKYSTNSMDKIKSDYNDYRSNQMQVNQLTKRNCA